MTLLLTIILAPVIFSLVFILRLFGVFTFSYLWFLVILILVPLLLFCFFVLPTLFLLMMVSFAAA